jgi:hypothetical protein
MGKNSPYRLFNERGKTFGHLDLEVFFAYQMPKNDTFKNSLGKL